MERISAAVKTRGTGRSGGDVFRQAGEAYEPSAVMETVNRKTMLVL